MSLFFLLLLLSPPFPPFMIYAIIGTVKKNIVHISGGGGVFRVRLDLVHQNDFVLPSLIV